MGISSVLYLSFLPISILLLFSHEISSEENTDLIFKGCANQKFQDPSGIYSQNLKSVFDYLLTQSLKTKFSNTTSGDTQSIFGMYQCRGDLTPLDCSHCVSQFPKRSKKLCGEAVAVRVQLVGCYMRYEVSGFMQVSTAEFLYKYCKSSREVSESGFEANRDMGFDIVEKGVAGNGGFNVTSYGGVYVLGQCEGDLGGEECRDCVRTAFERVKVECGGSSLGQVYLHRCYVSYNYHPNGALDSPGPGTKKSAAKTIAIVVGATAAAGFIVAILMCIKSAFKKKRVKQSHVEYYY